MGLSLSAPETLQVRVFPVCCTVNGPGALRLAVIAAEMDGTIQIKIVNEV